MKRICSLVLIVAVMLSATSCKAGSQESQEPSTSIPEAEITESTPETTVYTDETAVIVEYEPVDYYVFNEDVDIADLYPDDYDWFNNGDDYWSAPERYVPDDFYDNLENVYYIQMYDEWHPMDELDRNQYYFGLEDPALVNFLSFLVENDSGVDLSDENVTIDSFDYLNAYSCDFQSGHASYDSITYYFTFNQASMDVIASQDHRLERAVMVALGRKYFIQEIPYSFFRENFLNDTEYLGDDDWYFFDGDFAVYLDENYSWTNVVDAFLTTEHIMGYNSEDGVIYETGEDMANRGYYGGSNPISYIENEDVFLDRVFLSLTNPVYVGEVNEQNYEFYRTYYSFDFESYEDEPGWIPDAFESLDLYNAAYEFLPVNTVACLTCVRYNRQFNVSARYNGEPAVLYRDMDNGAITMDLNDTRMGYVVQAFENAGYPLQTDNEGNIVAESPAHFREVYGEEYTDVLAEYGLDVTYPIGNEG